MLRRFYADNFRCLTNLELELDEANVFLGANGTGKTSVLEVLRKIQDLISRGRRVDEIFPARDLTQSQDSDSQRFEIETCIDSQSYRYELTVEHDRNHGKMRISKEVLEHDGRPIFELRMGEAQLYDDDYVPVPNTFPFDWTLSGIGTLYERPNNRKLTRFKKEIANYVIVGSCPPVIKPETRSSERFLEPLMENFVGWFHRYSQENMGSIGGLFEALRESLPDFHSIRITESGESSHALKAMFLNSSNKKRTVEYGFDQLSDGQRALIVLYSLIRLANDRVSLFIDEPDNYLSLREIQPWLAHAIEECGQSVEQIVVVSHHPVTIDYMAGAQGRWFSRDGDGPVRISDEPRTESGGLSISESIARGWQE